MRWNATSVVRSARAVRSRSFQRANRSTVAARARPVLCKLWQAHLPRAGACLCQFPHRNHRRRGSVIMITGIANITIDALLTPGPEVRARGMSKPLFRRRHAAIGIGDAGSVSSSLAFAAQEHWNRTWLRHRASRYSCSLVAVAASARPLRCRPRAPATRCFSLTHRMRRPPAMWPRASVAKAAWRMWCRRIPARSRTSRRCSPRPTSWVASRRWSTTAASPGHRRRCWLPATRRSGTSSTSISPAR